MHKNLTKNKLWLALILVSTFLVYIPLLTGYFQHDEIFALARYFTNENKPLIEVFKQSFTPTIGHFVPLHQLLVHFYISAFKMNYAYYSLASIAAHLGVVFLLFKLGQKIFKNTTTALVGAAIFALSVSGHQATSWPLSDISIHGATIFGLLAFLAILDKKLVNSVIFLLISLLFKETTIGLFLYLPIVFWIYFPKESEKLRVFVSLFVSGFIYISARALMLLAPQSHPQDKLVTNDQSIIEIITNTLLFPIKSLTQTIIPPKLLLLVSRSISKLLPDSLTGLYGTTQFDLFVEDKFLLLIEFLLILLIVRVLIYFKKNKIIWTGFLFVVINSLVYVLSPDRSGRIPFIDSRNLYFPLVGTSIMLAFLLQKKKLLIAALLVLNVFWLNKEVQSLANTGAIRKEIMETVKSKYPTLPQKVVFYSQSDKSYYGMPESEKLLPFQTNFGLNLLIYYLPSEKYSSKFFDDNSFLIGLTEEGYREVSEQGFGYYRNWDKLTTAVSNNNLTPGNVISFRFNSVTGYLEDTTPETRTRLSEISK